jgi:FKBP-type peptidyl-prolyl cis-trans isomerase
MHRQRTGLRVEDVQLGTGAEATRESEALVRFKLFLNRGEQIPCEPSVSGATETWVDLRRRQSIAGLRYGIQGMRVGGVRVLRVPPHLGYGATGLPGRIPPGVVLRFEVSLLALRPSPPSRQRSANGSQSG